MTTPKESAANNKTGRLISDTLADDMEAKEGLIRQYRPWILRNLQQRMGELLRSREEADDLTQMVCEKLFVGIHRFQPQGDGISSFEGWLRTIINRTALEAGRKATRQSRTQGLVNLETDLLGHTIPESSTASRGMRRRDALRLLGDAVKQLGEREREAIETFYLGGLRGDQAARALEMTPAQLNSLLQRTRRKLKEILGPSSVFFQSG